MSLPNPPPGWIDLQERAKRAKNPEELAAIIEQMNKLLSEYEKAAGGGHHDNLMPTLDHNSDKKQAR